MENSSCYYSSICVLYGDLPRLIVLSFLKVETNRKIRIKSINTVIYNNLIEFTVLFMSYQTAFNIESNPIRSVSSENNWYGRAFNFWLLTILSGKLNVRKSNKIAIFIVNMRPRVLLTILQKMTGLRLPKKEVIYNLGMKPNQGKLLSPCTIRTSPKAPYTLF